MGAARFWETGFRKSPVSESPRSLGTGISKARFGKGRALGKARIWGRARFWEGHGFSRAAPSRERCGLQPLRDAVTLDRTHPPNEFPRSAFPLESLSCPGSIDDMKETTRVCA